MDKSMEHAEVLKNCFKTEKRDGTKKLAWIYHRSHADVLISCFKKGKRYAPCDLQGYITGTC